MQVKVLLKLLVLGGLSILMLIALASIGGITNERKQRLYDVRSNIARSYAGPQRITGPVFAIEYRESWTDKVYNEEKGNWYDKDISLVKTKLVYPEDFNYDGSLDVEERTRGIFKANVFKSKGHIAGSVKMPEENAFHSKETSSIEVLSAKACLLVNDQRGISDVVFEWNNTPLEIIPGSGIPRQDTGIHAELPEPGKLYGHTFDFAMDLNVHGMGQLMFVPIGSDNRIRLESEWPHPSFMGDFLATTRTISDAGFSAEWNVNNLACSAQLRMDEGQYGGLQNLGVDLIDPVNPYPLTDRALKYGFLFVFITFAAFFLFELVKQLKIHPIQYGFVGLAQALFFLLLLSLSEHISFGLSYLIASFATIAVITFYLCSVLRGFGRAALFGGVLSLLYGALYGLLQSEDHALVAGSTLLFGLTAFVMMLTRKIDWYALGTKQEAGA